MLHISFLHELGWRCQKVPIGGQKHLESRGCQVFYGLRLQVVWAARCLHGVPSGKDRHAAASFACEGPAACTQPLMYCVNARSESNWTRLGWRLFFPQPEKQCQVQSCPEAVYYCEHCLVPCRSSQPAWPYLSGRTWRVKGCGWKLEHVVIRSSQGICPCLF